MNKLTRGISLLLILTLMLMHIPSKAIAEEIKDNKESNQLSELIQERDIEVEEMNKPPDEVDDLSDDPYPEIDELSDEPPIFANDLSDEPDEAEIIGEIVEKREENTKYFLRSDYTYEAAVYPNAVHYYDNGQWREIDNRLVDEKSGNEGLLSNKNNSYNIKFAKNTKSKKLVRITKDKYELSWNIEGVNNSLADGKPLNTKASGNLSNNEKKKQVNNLTSVATYKDIFKNVDIEYVILPEYIKENILLRDVPDISEFSFEISTKRLSPVVNEDNSIGFISDENGKLIFTIQAPFMYDSLDGYSTDIDMSLTKYKNGYKLTIKPDRDWIESEDRVYPVVIDPIVETGKVMKNIRDSYVSEGLPNTNYQNFNILKTGYGSTSKRNRTYIRFADMPSLSADDMVVGAYLSLATEAYAATSQVNVHRVTSSWASESITWNNKASYNSIIEDYQIVNTKNKWYIWDITGVVKDWYIGRYTNHGIMLKAQNEAGGYTHFHSSEQYYYPDLMPTISIVYVNNSGLEDYWTYRSHGIGRAGTGYVNDFNGNLVIVHNTANTSGNRMPIQYSHVYNSGHNRGDIGYGMGWRTNYDQRVASTTINGINYLEYTDVDGTKHYFKYDSKSKLWKDETGLDLTIDIASSQGQYYDLKDKQGNVLRFYGPPNQSLKGKLYKITDANGNFATVKYANYRISEIIDGVGKKITFTYDSIYHLKTVVDSSGKKTTFNYNGYRNLTEIIYPDGKVSKFQYNNGPNELLSITNHDGYKVSYTYTSANPKRVSSISESNTDGTLGQRLNLTYKHTETVFKDIKNRETVYQFNYYGNTVSTKDSMGYGGYYEYQKLNTADNNRRNKLTVESKPQKSVINLLKNHSFEATANWTLGNWSGSTGTGSYTTAQKNIGSRSISLNKTNTAGTLWYMQTLRVEKGRTYTLSGYVKTSGISSTNGKGAVLIARYENASGAQPIVKSRYINGSKEWQKVELTFTVPSDATSTSIWIRVGIEGETGTAYFDSIQLEEEDASNRYNLLENPDMTHGTNNIPLSWSKSSTCNDSDRWIDMASSHAPGLHQYGFRILGSASNEKYLRQTVRLTGSKNDVFTVGGWAKANSMPLTEGSGREFALRVIIGYTNRAPQTKYIRFNPDVSDWQFASGQIIAESSSYYRIQVDLVYTKNVNSVYFDGIGLYKEQFSQSYTYDSNGNITSVEDLAKNKSTFDYNGNNDLTKLVTPRGSTYTYSYDSKHNLLKATTATGVVYDFGYDSYGNIKSTKVSNGTLFMKSNATYTADGNYLRSITDSRGKQVVYDTDLQTGLLKSVKDAQGNTTTYSYDVMDRIASVSAKNGSVNVTNKYAYDGDYLKSITHNGFSYYFDYDKLGNNTKVRLANRTLITNTYEKYSGRITGKLLKSTYGNNHSIEYIYDSLDRVVGTKYDGTQKFAYGFTASGKMGYHKDMVNKVDYHYEYDLAERLSKVKKSNGYETQYMYNMDNNISQIRETIGNKTYFTAYSYDKDNRPTSTEFSNPYIKHMYKYDTLGRVSEEFVGFNYSSLDYHMNYTYLPGVDGSTTGLVKSTADGFDNVSYDYDNNGNIKTIIQNGQRIDYVYDALNQLIRENNKVLNKTIAYEYDAGGNIKSKKEFAYTTGTLPTTPLKETPYTYDASWKDLLVSYDGSTITYDTIGNPLSYRGLTMTWEHGRQLKSITGNGKNISYKYNDSGIRTEKNVNGKVTKYHLVGSNVTYETSGTDKIYYYYNGSGVISGMQLNDTYYFFTKNAQGDVTGILDLQGNKVVTYTYDSWGNIVDATDTSGIGLATKNPYRYRGYRYDEETGLFYVGSRYYDPEIGRFVNADSQIAGVGGDIRGYNMFAYCFNNPVNMSDPSGHWPKWLKDIGNGIKKAATAVANFFSPNTNTISGSFQEGPFVGSGSLTAGYSEIMLRGQGDKKVIPKSGEPSVTVGAFAKVSGGNAGGKVGIGNKDASLSLKGVGDVLTASAQAGLKYQDGFGLTAKAKAAVFSGRATVEFQLFGWQIEFGVTGDALSAGAEATIGIFDGGFEAKANASLGVGGGSVFRVKPG